MLKNRIVKNKFKIIAILSIIVPILVILYFLKSNYTLLSNKAVCYDINYLFLIAIGIINIITTIIIFIKKEKLNKYFIIIYSLYIILSASIPIYHIKEERAPTGPFSHLMGVEIVDKYNDIYGINISWIINLF